MSRPTTTTTSFTENCAVCKSSRYLNPSIRFLMSSICYHRMCESCVQRLFGNGPGPCPIVACGRKLHRNRFRTQLFEDVAVEREVDIRRRVGRIYNRREEQFVSDAVTATDADATTDTTSRVCEERRGRKGEAMRKQANARELAKRRWDDYLEHVEELVWSLIHGDEETRAAADAEIRAYEAAHKKDIRTNMARERSERERAALRLREEERAVLEERGMLAREEAAAVEESESARTAQLEAMARGDRAEVGRIRERLARSAGERKARIEAQLEYFRAQREGKLSSLRTLELNGDGGGERLARVWKPLGTGYTGRSEWTSLQDDYDMPMLDGIRKDRRMLAGGYVLGEVYRKWLFEAFSGLTVFVGEEDPARTDVRVGDARS